MPRPGFALIAKGSTNTIIFIREFPDAQNRTEVVQWFEDNYEFLKMAATVIILDLRHSSP